jgi:hypothetical protein
MDYHKFNTKNSQVSPSQSFEDHHSVSTSTSTSSSSNKMPQHQHSLDVSTDFVDTVVRTSKVCSTMLLEYCSLCTVYIDKQVQYELSYDSQGFWNTLSGGFVGTSDQNVNDLSCDYSTNSIRRPSARELDMFDEESVVESVEMRL